jgi:uncharacterized protein with FMN-binding domain
MIGWDVGLANMQAASTIDTAASSASAAATAAAPAAAAPAAPAPAAPAAASSATSAPAAAAAPVPAGAADGTYNGSTVRTSYGTVQVAVTIAGGKITDVAALKLTDQGGRSVSISAQAAPMLRDEVLSAQSAKVSSIGGATYTSSGYLKSLQAALDSANFTG